MHRARSVLLAAALAVSTAAQALDVEGRFGVRTREAFDATHSWPYAADPARAAKIVGGVATIKLCMRHTELASVLGAPDFGGITHRSGDPPGKHSGVTWTWTVRKEEWSFRPTDRSVTAWFDLEGRVVALVVHGIDGVNSTYGGDQPCK
jgi:hypothetical protein